MPYEWVTPEPRQDQTALPRAELHLWPYRSLPKRGFVLFIAITAGLLLLPLMSVLGTAVLWVLLPFLLLALAALWWALQASYRAGSVLEELRLWPDRVHLARFDPKGRHREWEANPYWVRICLDQDSGPVENYVTLEGAGREVEIGAFLTAEERLALHDELKRRFGETGV